MEEIEKDESIQDEKKDKNEALKNYISLLNQRWNAMNPKDLSKFYDEEKDMLDNAVKAGEKFLKIEDYGTRCVLLGKFIDIKGREAREKIKQEEIERKQEEDRKYDQETDEILKIFDERDKEKRGQNEGDR